MSLSITNFVLFILQIKFYNKCASALKLDQTFAFKNISIKLKQQQIKNISIFFEFI